MIENVIRRGIRRYLKFTLFVPFGEVMDYVGSSRIAQIGSHFFLIAEIEANTTAVEIDPLFAVRATTEQARRLIRGV
ncbi:hypothetical protein ACYEXS_30475 [Paenibacillus sp. MAH-36]|uniref:Uncharacterized protein n=1 Tax=Paenibacillus violae TaxID=3077234 RepID=A0ABU3RKL4_9BACL|nr:hypothetical protein [Paenibacillus sp. PFR10]MDU0204823.1 hypothetical protein [Paenibacillus sp. PFR10]